MDCKQSKHSFSLTDKEIVSLYEFYKKTNQVMYLITVDHGNGVGPAISVEVDGSPETGVDITDYAVW